MRIDDGMVKQVAVGDTKARVIELLGAPTGQAIFPIATPKGSSIFSYEYLETSRHRFTNEWKKSGKGVFVEFDAQGLVGEVTTSESVPE